MIIEQGAPQAPAGIGGRTRITVIAVVALLAVAIGAVLGSLLVRGAGASLGTAAAYVPSDAVMYMEARLDLPPQQRDNLRALLERFPDVNADDFLTDALASTLDEAFANAGAPVDYSNDIAPWFAGSVAVAVLEYPVATDPMLSGTPATVIMFGVRDPATASDFADTVRSEMEDAGQPFTSSDHAGVTVWSVDTTVQSRSDGDVTYYSMPASSFAYAVTDDQLLLGNDADAVIAALDASRGSDSIADADGLGHLLASLPEERAGLAVVNTAAMMAQTRAQLESMDPALAGALAPYLDSVPPISVAAFSFASDAVLLDGASDRPGGPMRVDNGTRDLAAMVPADALFYVDSEALGTGLEQGVAAIKAALVAASEQGAEMPSVDQIEGILGADLEDFVSWIGAGAFAAGWDGDQVYVGMVLEATDPDAAAQRLGQLRALAQLAAVDPSSGIVVSTQSADGVDITTIRFDGMSSGAPMGELPFAPAMQYAIDGDRVVLGLGDRFVETALSLDEASSLASSDRFGSAIARFGGSSNASSFFVDLAGIRETVATQVPPDATSGYEQVKPYLLPFDYLAGVTRIDGDRQVSRGGLVLR
jgi:hypothetical protein